MISDVNMLRLIGKMWKACKVRNFVFIQSLNEFPAIFSNVESGAWPKLAQSYYFFFRFEALSPFVFPFLPFLIWKKQILKLNDVPNLDHKRTRFKSSRL